MIVDSKTATQSNREPNNLFSTTVLLHFWHRYLQFPILLHSRCFLLVIRPSDGEYISLNDVVML